MKHYTAKQVNEIKQEIRTGKPVAIIADELATQWGRPVAGVYGKVLKLSKLTRIKRSGKSNFKSYHKNMYNFSTRNTICND